MDRLGELAADYECTRELGRGGTAVVYHARELTLDREVAIKVVHQTHANDKEAVARLVREARLVAQLRHPNIVTLYSTRNLADGSIALIMQYVPGRTLKDAIRTDGPLPIATVNDVLRGIGFALEYAHQRHGLIHRDIKPENIYLDTEGDRVLLSDFGIARSTEAESTLTLVGTALGTPAYMSPEQIDGLPLDARSDLYSLGLVAYEMLTGQQPWSGHNLYTIIYKQKHEDLPPITEFRRDVPPAMQRAIDGLLRKDREQRWSDATRFLSVLRPPGAVGGIAPPAITHRPANRRRPAVEPPEDTPTIGFRPSRDVVPQAPLDSPAADPEPTSGDDIPVPPVRFELHDGDKDAGSDVATYRATYRATAVRHNRRGPMIAGGIVALMIGAVAMVPLLGPSDGPGAPADSTGDPVSGGVASATETSVSEVGPPTRLVVLTDELTGRAGAALGMPVGLIVEDRIGRPVTNATVEIEVTTGEGSVDPVVVVSDPRGVVMTRWTLGAVPGPNALIARVRGMPGVVAELHASGVAGPAARMIASGGGDQTAPLLTALPDDLVVRVEDSAGHPVAGARVAFNVEEGDGTIEPAVATTDGSGRAHARWRVGSEPGTETARASFGELTVEFSARAEYRLWVEPRLVAGGTHTCRLVAGGELMCWGANDSGQLGSGTMERSAGAAVRGAPPFARLAVGVSHTCALDRSGRAYCWGANDVGQLGVGDRTDHPAPQPVISLEQFDGITAGLTHTCALKGDGSAFCWGGGTNGQVGDGMASDRSSPALVVGGLSFTELSAGWRHTCGLTTEGAFCWGSNANGQLGNGTLTNRSAPTRVSGDLLFTSIAMGAAHSCGITQDGAVYCWGQNSSGQLGIGSGNDSARPVRIQSTESFRGVVAGAVHTCALAISGQVFCWGSNNFGQLGNGSNTDAAAPVAVTVDLLFTSLTASGSHTCGRAVSGEYYCWGYNVDGQLGDGTRTNRLTPVSVRGAAR